MEDSFSTAIAPRSLILAGLIAAALMTAAIVMFPYIDAPIARGSNLRVVQITALTVLNGLTAYLVLLQFYVERKPAIALLSAAFGYSALMTAYQLANLPGVFFGTGNLMPGSHRAVWVWVGRLSGTAVLIMLAMLALHLRQERRLPQRMMYLATALTVLAPFGLAILMLGVLSQQVPDLGHLVTKNGDYSALSRSWVGILLPACWVGALLSILLVTRLKSAFHCWLALSCYSYILYLVIVFSSSIRFTVGWYASRFFELAAASIMLGALLFQVLKLQMRLQHSYRQAYEQSISDSLTGLCSRRHFDDALERTLHQQSRQPAPLTLLMADIDFFKQYNDHFGHVQGDQCIRKIAACMTEQLRGGDTIARYGGEEFIAILQNCDAKDALLVAERFRAAVEGLAIAAPPAEDASHRSVVTVSIGLHCHQAGISATARQLVQQADMALYTAKREGRNRVCLLTPLAKA